MRTRHRPAQHRDTFKQALEVAQKRCMQQAADEQEDDRCSDEVYDAVYDWFVDVHDVGGRSVTAAVESLAARGFAADDVRRAIDELHDDGNLYTTIDDEHFAATKDDHTAGGSVAT